MLGMAYIRVLEVATFYTMFLLAPVGKKAHVQVCGTTPCLLRGAEELFEVCARKIHPEPLHVSADGKFSWEEVECLGACVNAPMVLIWNDTYEDLTPRRFEKVLDGFATASRRSPARRSTASHRLLRTLPIGCEPERTLQPTPIDASNGCDRCVATTTASRDLTIPRISTA